MDLQDFAACQSAWDADLHPDEVFSLPPASWFLRR